MREDEVFGLVEVDEIGGDPVFGFLGSVLCHDLLHLTVVVHWDFGVTVELLVGRSVIILDRQRETERRRGCLECP